MRVPDQERLTLRRRPDHGGDMRTIFVATLFAGAVAAFSGANAADGCGPGCYQAPLGGCVVNGWGGVVNGWVAAPSTPVRNECPVGAAPRPPCPPGYIWLTRYRACSSRIETCVSRTAICKPVAGRGLYRQRLPQNVSLWSASFLDAIVVTVRQRVLVSHLERDAADIPEGAGCEDPPVGLDLRLT